MSLLGEIEHALRGWTHGPAILEVEAEGVREISAASLLERIDTRAGELHAAGLRGGDRVALLLRNSSDFLATFLAAAKIGAVPAPLKTDWRSTELGAVFANLEPTLTVAEEESKIEILEHGADDYIAKPLNIRELDARIRNLCTMQKYQQALARAEELQKRMSELAMSFSQSLEMRDQYTGEHSWDVLDLGTMIAEELGLEVDEQFRDALLLHDVGKLGIPDRILLKNDRLTAEEWEVMKRHAELGADLLRKFDSFNDIAEVILAHQEHYDGTGYPRGLSGESIPMVARVVAVADAWHAMTGDRPYRSALPIETALGELIRNKRRQFDPRIVDALVDALLRRRVIAEEQLEAAR